MSFEALPSARTAELLADQIREAILVGNYKPGDRLIEQELSDSFGTSRGPIREAIRLLASEGLIELRKNRGAVVAAANFDDVLEVYAIRMSLGSIALSHACHAQKHGDLDTSLVNKKLSDLNKAIGGNPFATVTADLDFQTALIELGALPRITETFQRTAVDIAVFVRFLGIRYEAADHQELVSRHVAILDAVRSGNVDLAVTLWTDHIRQSVREFMRAFSEIEIVELFERPLMQDVFEVENAR